mmetsp:Transcript_12126/g.26772  ORF Transcript_12126/g.26772 Transcript_12126/m.26772 type:complete len:209 (+) Transcript_12126:1095-1721(+)
MSQDRPHRQGGRGGRVILLIKSSSTTRSLASSPSIVCLQLLFPRRTRAHLASRRVARLVRNEKDQTPPRTLVARSHQETQTSQDTWQDQLHYLVQVDLGSMERTPRRSQRLLSANCQSRLSALQARKRHLPARRVGSVTITAGSCHDCARRGGGLEPRVPAVIAPAAVGLRRDRDDDHDFELLLEDHGTPYKHEITNTRTWTPKNSTF